MSGGLTSTIDPALLAEQGARLKGRIAIRGMARLRSLLASENGEADIDLNFSRTEGSGVRIMQGRILATVEVACQRCLEPMALELQVEANAVVVREGEESGLPPETDVLPVSSSTTVLAELVEDELLLVMPMVPMHPLEECPARKYLSSTDKKHPFAVLASKTPPGK
jgi:uncharacterized protein